MKYDGEFAFFAGLFFVGAVVAVCVTYGQTHYRTVTVEYAKAGLQECVKYGGQDTVWQRECQ